MNKYDILLEYIWRKFLHCNYIL